MAKSNASRSIDTLRSQGYTAEMVERWIPRANVRRDLFKVIDLVAIKEGVPGVLGVQATSRQQMRPHILTCDDSEELRIWLAAGNRFELHGWYKARNRWYVDVEKWDAAKMVLA